MKRRSSGSLTETTLVPFSGVGHRLGDGAAFPGVDAAPATPTPVLSLRGSQSQFSQTVSAARVIMKIIPYTWKFARWAADHTPDATGLSLPPPGTTSTNVENYFQPMLPAEPSEPLRIPELHISDEDKRDFADTMINLAEGMHARREYLRTPEGPVSAQQLIDVVEESVNNPISIADQMRLMEEFTRGAAEASLPPNPTNTTSSINVSPLEPTTTTTTTTTTVSPDTSSRLSPPLLMGRNVTRSTSSAPPLFALPPPRSTSSAPPLLALPPPRSTTSSTLSSSTGLVPYNPEPIDLTRRRFPSATASASSANFDIPHAQPAPNTTPDMQASQRAFSASSASNVGSSSSSSSGPWFTWDRVSSAWEQTRTGLGVAFCMHGIEDMINQNPLGVIQVILGAVAIGWDVIKTPFKAIYTVINDTKNRNVVKERNAAATANEKKANEIAEEANKLKAKANAVKATSAHIEAMRVSAETAIKRIDEYRGKLYKRRDKIKEAKDEANDEAKKQGLNKDERKAIKEKYDKKMGECSEAIGNLGKIRTQITTDFNAIVKAFTDEDGDGVSVLVCRNFINNLERYINTLDKTYGMDGFGFIE